MTIEEYKNEKDLLVDILAKVYDNNVKGVEKIINSRLNTIMKNVATLAFRNIEKQQKGLEPFSWEDIDELD